MQIALDIPRIDHNRDDAILQTRPRQMQHQQYCRELALAVQLARAEGTPRRPILQRVIFDGRAEVVIHGGRGPHEARGCGWRGGCCEDRVEQLEEEEVTEDVRAELHVVALCGELVHGWNHDPRIQEQHVKLLFTAVKCRGRVISGKDAAEE